jgi:autotransporter-associated beta strand protein
MKTADKTQQQLRQLIKGFNLPLGIFVAFVVSIISPPAFAANRTWVAAPPTDANWSDSANWGGTAPVPGDAVIFNDSTTNNLNNDIAPQPLTGITFNATTNTSFTITNNAIYLNGNITDDSTNLQIINLSLLMTNGTKTVSMVPGANLTIGGIIGNYQLAGQNNGLTLSQNIPGSLNYGFSTASFSNYFNFLSPAVVTFNGSAGNTYTNTTTVNGGTILLLDFSNMGVPVNLLNNGGTATVGLTLGGGTYSLKGKPTGTTLQTNNGTLTLSGNSVSGITLNPNGGTAISLTLGNTWTRNAGSALNVDISAGGTLYANPALGNGLLGYATVKDAISTGFATTNSTGNIVRYTGATALTSGANSTATNFITSGTLTMSAASFGVNSLTLDATAGNGVLDLGGATDAMTNTSRGILMIGANNFTIQNGQIGAPGLETIINQMGSGTLTLNSTLGAGAAALTKSGNGILVLAGASTNTGTVLIGKGTVQAGAASTKVATGISGPLGNGTLQVNAGGVLDLNGYNVQAGAASAGVGVGLITNSGALSQFIVGNNGLSTAKALGNTLLAGPIQLVITGTNSAFGTIFANNTYTGGTILTNNGGTASANQLRFTSSGAFGTGTLYFAGGGALQNTVSQTLTNAVNVNGVNNLWNAQNSSGTAATITGPWTGNGTILINQGFHPIIAFNNDMSAFQGTLQLVAGGAASAGNNACTYTLVPSNFNGSQAVWTLGSGTGVAGGITTLQCVNTNSGLTFPLGDLNTTGNAGNGAITLNNGAANTTNIFQVGALGLNSTFSGVISDNQVTPGTDIGITKVGTGTWTLTGAETYSGPTTISNGILVVNGSIGNGPQFAASPVEVYAPGALGGSGSIVSPVVLNSGNAAINLINGVGATFSLNGGLILNNGNILGFDLGTVSDQIAVSGGLLITGTTTINIGTANGFGNGTYTLISGASISSTNGFVLGTTPVGYTCTLLSDGSNLQVQVQVNPNIPGTAFWDNHVSTVWNGHTGFVYNWDTDLSSSINASNFPGIPTAVTFAASGANNFNTTLGADFTINSLTFATPNPVTIGGANALTINGNVAVNSGAGTNTISVGSVVLGVSQTWTVTDAANQLIVSSPVIGTGKTLELSGPGSFVMNGTNSYTGGTTIDNAGTLYITNNVALTSGGLVINNGTLAVTSINTIPNPIDLAGSAVVTNSGQALTLAGAITDSGNLTEYGAGTLVLPTLNLFSGGATLYGSNVLCTINGALGTGPLTISSGSTLILDGNNDGDVFPSSSVSGPGYINFTPTGGQLTFNDDLSGFVGTFIINSNNAGAHNKLAINSSPNAAAIIIISNGATLYVSPTSPQNIAGNIYVTGLGNSENLGAIRLENSTLTGTVTLMGNISIGAQGGNPGTFGGVIQDGGNGYGITKVGARTNILAGANTFSGNTVINAGFLDLANSYALQNSTLTSGGANLIFDSAVANNTFVLGALAGNASLGLTNNAGAGINLVVGNNNTNSTWSGPLSDGGLGGALTKIGTGILTLTGTNTYIGLTTVSNGTLVVSSGQQGGGNFVVNDSNTLGVINVGGGPAFMGNLSLGNSVGATILMFTNVSSTTVPVVDATNVVTVDVTNTIQFASTNGLVVGNTYPLLKYGSLAGAGFAGFGLSTPTNVTAVLTNDTGNLWIALKIISISTGVNTNPTNITTTISGNQLVLSWPADHTGWLLQAQTNTLTTGLGTNWVTIPNSNLSNSYTNTIQPANGAVFYRMFYP